MGYGYSDLVKVMTTPLFFFFWCEQAQWIADCACADSDISQLYLRCGSLVGLYDASFIHCVHIQ